MNHFIDYHMHTVPGAVAYETPREESIAIHCADCGRGNWLEKPWGGPVRIKCGGCGVRFEVVIAVSAGMVTARIVGQTWVNGKNS